MVRHKEARMKVMRFSQGSRDAVLSPAESAVPTPAPGEVLVRVHAAGVTPTELLWYPTTHGKDGSPRTGAVPGHEFSGVVEALGEGAREFRVGDAVYGLNDWFAEGATAEFCVTTEAMLAPKPVQLSHTEAATVPIGALTAWQGLLQRARLSRGERILIHGGAGAVGLFAVQMAHAAGAHVISTASAATLEFVRSLGADEVIDYRGAQFENEVKDVDVVFDTVGGETRDRSWSVLKPGGRMVTIAADAEYTSEQRVKDAFLLVEADAGQLREIAQKLDDGEIKTYVRAVVPWAEAAAAYQGSIPGKGYGKTVIAVEPG